MTYKLETVEKNILQNDLEIIEDKIAEAKSTWQSKYNVLAYSKVVK